jgi:hypothetical protein
MTGSVCCQGRDAGWNATRRCITPWGGRIDREAKPEVAATIYGASSHYLDNAAWTNRVKLPIALANLRGVLGDPKFDRYVAIGAAMAPAEAVAYARHQIHQARHQIGDAT